MADRKARLAALAARAGRGKEAAPPEESEPSEPPANETTTVKFRNYVPNDSGVGGKSNKEEDDPPLAKKPRTEETKQKTALEEELERAKKDVTPALVNQHDNLTAMGPKKINWDLKRDIQQKLDKLERRTQRSIVQLLRERLEKEADEQLSGDEDEELD